MKNYSLLCHKLICRCLRLPHHTFFFLLLSCVLKLFLILADYPGFYPVVFSREKNAFREIWSKILDWKMCETFNRKSKVNILGSLCCFRSTAFVQTFSFSFFSTIFLFWFQFLLTIFISWKANRQIYDFIALKSIKIYPSE